MSTKNTDFETVLDSCLSGLRSGRATIDDCLVRHPEHAGQLEPLLRVAGRLQAEPRPVLSEASRRRIEARLQSHVRQLPPRRRVIAKSPRRAPLFGLLRWASTVVAIVLVLSLVTGGTIYASGSLPGEPLYVFKAWGERVQTWFTPQQNRPEMHLEFAQRRLNEVMAMGHLGVVDDLAIIHMESEVRRAMELLPMLPEDKRAEVTQEILDLSNRQRVVLTSLTHYTPPLSQAGLEWGIDMATRRVATLGVTK